MSEEQWTREREAFLSLPRLAGRLTAELILRSPQGLDPSQDYAIDLRGEHGSFGKMVAKWPSEDIVNLWHKMKDEGSRLGGSTGPYFLRAIGKDTWLPTHSVMTALVAWGVNERPTKGKRNLADGQAAFNQWREESGYTFAELSRIAAMSVPD